MIWLISENMNVENDDLEPLEFVFEKWKIWKSQFSRNSKYPKINFFLKFLKNYFLDAKMIVSDIKINSKTSKLIYFGQISSVIN